MNRSRRTRDRRGSADRLPRRLLLLSSDQRLVELVLGGDDSAFELLYDRHVADALWFASEVLGSREQAEEAVRHAFAAAHAYLARGDGREIAFAPWLHTILANHCLSLLQERRDPALPASAAEPATVIDLDEWRRRKQLGVGLPLAPSAGFQDSVMAACGIGAGATAAGTSLLGGTLLGGTLAKVAAVALLAGGVGVAGDATLNRDAPVDAGTRPASPVEAVEASGAPTLVTPDSSRLRDRGGGTAPPGLPLSKAPAGADDGSPLGLERPVLTAPLEGRAAPSNDALAALPTGAQPPTQHPQLGLPVEPISRLEERLEAQLPEAVELPKVKLPKEVELPRVKLPRVKLPRVKPPQVELPPVDLPKPRLPKVKLPKVKPPKVVDSPPVVDDEAVTPDTSPVDGAAAAPSGTEHSAT